MIWRRTKKKRRVERDYLAATHDEAGGPDSASLLMALKVKSAAEQVACHPFDPWMTYAACPTCGAPSVRVMSSKCSICLQEASHDLHGRGNL